MQSHIITVTSRDAFDEAVSYLSQDFEVTEREAERAVLRLRRRAWWKYAGRILLSLITIDNLQAPHVPGPDSVRDIPRGTRRIEVRLTGGGG